VKNDGLSDDDQLDVVRLVAEITEAGTPASYRPGVDGILAALVEQSQPGDLVVVMANSGFGGLTTKLLDALSKAQE
jgi:UDP-N-acetylmuramate-alanine ligase